MNKYKMPEIENTKELTNDFFDKYIERAEEANRVLESMIERLDKIIEKS